MSIAHLCGLLWAFPFLIFFQLLDICSIISRFCQRCISTQQRLLLLRNQEKELKKNQKKSKGFCYRLFKTLKKCLVFCCFCCCVYGKKVGEKWQNRNNCRNGKVIPSEDGNESLKLQEQKQREKEAHELELKEKELKNKEREENENAERILVENQKKLQKEKDFQDQQNKKKEEQKIRDFEERKLEAEYEEKRRKRREEEDFQAEVDLEKKRRKEHRESEVRNLNCWHRCFFFAFFGIILK